MVTLQAFLSRVWTNQSINRQRLLNQWASSECYWRLEDLFIFFVQYPTHRVNHILACCQTQVIPLTLLYLVQRVYRCHHSPLQGSAGLLWEQLQSWLLQAHGEMLNRMTDTRKEDITVVTKFQTAAEDCTCQPQPPTMMCTIRPPFWEKATGFTIIYAQFIRLRKTPHILKRATLLYKEKWGVDFVNS